MHTLVFQPSTSKESTREGLNVCPCYTITHIYEDTFQGTGSNLQSKMNATLLPHPHTKRSTLLPIPACERTTARLASTPVFANGGERLLPCQSAWPLIRLSDYPQILFPDGGEIGPQRPGPPQTLRAWRPPLISYLMEVL